MMRFIGIVTTLFIFVVLGFFGWQAYQDSLEPIDVRFVITSWPTAQLMRAVKTNKFFERQGIAVELIDVGNDYEAAVEAVRTGQADGGIFVLSEPLLMSGSGVPMKVVLGVDYSDGADGIVAAKEFSDIAELKGQRVAYQPGSFGDLLLREALKRSDLSIEDIISIPKNVFEASQDFLQGEVDAVVAFQPFMNQALLRPGSRLIFSSSEAPGLIPDVIAFRESFVEENRSSVTAFLNAWFDVVDALRSEEQVSQEIMAVVAITKGTTIEDIKRELKTTKLFTFADNAVAFTYIDDLISLYVSGQQFIDFFREVTNVAVDDVNLSRIIDPSFVRSGLRE